MKKVLVCIDRDGTIIEDAEFLGRNREWQKEVKFKEDVISLISYIQTSYNTTKIVVSNQTGVARRLFDCVTVEKINQYIDDELVRRGVKIDNWQYCPYADAAYAGKHPELKLDSHYVRVKTKRKPSSNMVYDAMKELKKDIGDFDVVLVLGDKAEDEGMAKELGALFIDVKERLYEELVKEFKRLLK